MTNKLRQYFPMIHTRQEVLAEIEAKPKLKQEFYSWEKKYRKEFLDFCTGVKGVKIMYDFISKEILNPETVPERVEELLSLLIGQQVHIKESASERWNTDFGRIYACDYGYGSRVGRWKYCKSGSSENRI